MSSTGKPPERLNSVAYNSRPDAEVVAAEAAPFEPAGVVRSELAEAAAARVAEAA